MGIIFNQKSQNEKRRVLRNLMPRSEALLWSRLKGRKIKGFKFRRQYSVGKYVIDFYCPEKKLAVEVDGITHTTDEDINYDKRRQSEIENFGIRFLRIRNELVIKNIDEVISCIEKKIEEII